ncbi:MAG: ABC transporter substrate-binding protein [Clostridia bacterium]|jgi:peptide/nickel transport system substrate-binding protein|nr:ABC transporter substrate-binding protein [Clostridia bacterium]
MKKFRRYLTGFLSIAILICAITGCGGSASSSNSSAKGSAAASSGSSSADASGTLKDRFTMARPIDSDNLDPVTNQYKYDIWVLASICEGLVKIGDDGSTVEPCLAKNWDKSEDGLTWTFHLLPDIKFSDGTPVTGADWVFSFERAMKHDESIFYAYCKSIDSVEAPDDTTFVLHLKYVGPSILTNLCMCNMVVQSKAYYDKVGEDNYINGPVATGPYYIKDWKKGEYLLLAKNPYYRDTVNMNEIMLKVVSDAQTRELMLQSGEVDLITEVPFNNINDLNSQDGITALGLPAGQERYFIINHRHKPFDNEKVREAIRDAVDIPQIINVVLAGQGQEANTFIPNACMYWDDSVPYPKRDVEKAKELLKEAGYPNGFSFEYCIVSGDSVQEQIATIVKQQLAEVGITANIVVYENAAFRDKYANNGLDFYVGQWTIQSNDPTSIADYWFIYDQSDAYMSGYKNDQLTKLNELAKHELDDTKRADYFKQMQETFYKDVVAIPIYWGTFPIAYSDKVKDFVQSPLGYYKFQYVKCYK